MDKHTFSATTLKYLAIIAMTVDHIAFAFVPATSALCYVMRLFGRLTAPLMCFFLSEGYRYTRNRKNYLLRLFAFAIISQPPYFYLVFRRMPNSIWECITHLNVMFTLGIALLTLMILQSRRIKRCKSNSCSGLYLVGAVRGLVIYDSNMGADILLLQTRHPEKKYSVRSRLSDPVANDLLAPV